MDLNCRYVYVWTLILLAAILDLLYMYVIQDNTLNVNSGRTGVITDCTSNTPLINYTVTVPLEPFVPIRVPHASIESVADRVASFSEIYDKHSWGLDNKYKGFQGSGYGSTLMFAQEAIGMLHNVINKVKTEHGLTKVRLLDLPCGDLVWMSRFLETRDDIEYTGVDIVPKVINNHKKKYASTNWKFIRVDVIRDDLPGAYDLILVRALLQHLKYTDAQQLVYNLQTKARYLLVNSYNQIMRNRELTLHVGRWRELSLMTPPFCLSPPLCIGREGARWEKTEGWMAYLNLYKLPLKRLKKCPVTYKVRLKGSKYDTYSCFPIHLAPSKKPDDVT